MNLKNGKKIFVEDEGCIGTVINAENNIVKVGDDEIEVNPEFCHMPTKEEWTQAELPVNEWETNNAETTDEAFAEPIGAHVEETETHQAGENDN